MANIFILEDSDERIKQFKKKLKHHKLIYTDNVEKAKKMYNEDIDTFLLDHDLDHKQFVDSNEENTGYQFAKFLSKQKGIKNKQIIIHSLNPAGAKNMKKVLPNAQIIPFPSLIVSL